MNVRLLAPLLALVALAPTVQASTGPFAGAVAQGETDVHVYDNNPDGDPCIDVMAVYTVELTYTPVTDVLALSAGGQTDVGAFGRAVVTFMASWCTSFEIGVSGTQVATLAWYVATVTRDDGGFIA